MHDFTKSSFQLFEIDEEEEEETVTPSLGAQFEAAKQGTPIAGEQPAAPEAVAPTPDTQPEGTPPANAGDGKPAEEPIVTIDGRDYKQSEVTAALAGQYNEGKWKANLTKQQQQLTAREQALQKQSEALSKLIQQQQQPQKPLTPEQQWLKENASALGLMTKDEVQEQLGSIQQVLQSQNQQAALTEIIDEVGDVQQKYGLSDADAENLFQYAKENNLMSLNMESVFIDMNRDKIVELFNSRSRSDAGRKRQAAAARVESGKAAAPGKEAPLRYDRAKHKDMSLDQLKQIAYQAYGLD